MTFLTGKIASFNKSNNSGLIQPDDPRLSTIKIFFHLDEFKNNSRPHVAQDQRVTFQVRHNLYVREDDRVKPSWYIGTIKAVNCILHSDNDRFLSVDQIVQLIPAS